MTWSDFYLICFAIGFLFSLLSFVAGGLNLHGHWPHVHFHSGTHSAGASAAGSHAPGGPQQTVSPFNFFTIAIFLAWFGGTGYLLTRFSTIVFVLGLVILKSSSPWPLRGLLVNAQALVLCGAAVWAARARVV